MTSSGWFSQEIPPQGSQRVFVETLQELAAGWQFDDLLPEHSFGSSWPIDESDCFVELEIPGLSFDDLRLRALYSPDNRRQPLLQAEWGEAHLFDGGPIDGLFVTGIDALPEQCASWTATWFEQQLQRPIVRREWDRPTSGPARILPSHTPSVAVTEWQFSDTGECLWSTSAVVWSHLMKTPPSRVIEERPDQRVTLSR